MGMPTLLTCKEGDYQPQRGRRLLSERLGVLLQFIATDEYTIIQKRQTSRPRMPESPRMPL